MQKTAFAKGLWPFGPTISPWGPGAGGREDAITPYAFVEDAIRPHVAGRFVDMLSAVVHHPGMLRYLDQTRSTGPNSKRGLRQGGGLNENLARELLELHTLGVGADYA